jgi:hypothetical protein
MKISHRQTELPKKTMTRGQRLLINFRLRQPDGRRNGRKTETMGVGAFLVIFLAVKKLPAAGIRGP